MQSATKKPSHTGNKKKSPTRNGKAGSFRHLAAFGLWADRADTKDPIEFAKNLRRKMEQGSDAS